MMKASKYALPTLVIASSLPPTEDIIILPPLPNTFVADQFETSLIKIQ